MKRTAIILLFLIIAPVYSAETVFAAPKQVTAAPVWGISLNLSQGMLSATNDFIGISGFSFRRLDADKKGFEIPFYLMLTNADTFTSSNSSIVSGLSIGSGFRFIKPLVLNEFIRVNFLSGFDAGYSGSWGAGRVILKLNRGPAHSFSLGITAGMEVEVPLGRFFSMPADTLCLAAGISASVSGSFGTNFLQGNSSYQSLSFKIAANSFGSSVNTLGIRYYF